MDFPAFLLTLLSGNWVFFNDGEISWDGKHHQITGIQINAAQIDQFMDFVNAHLEGFDDVHEVVQYFVTFMTEVEKDEGLLVPRSAIADGVAQALPEGDLTGITLSNLAACGAAFQVRTKAEDEYVVIFDTRLVRGIPAFFSLIARLLWDLRQGMNSQRGVPFTVTFVGARNIDADQYLGDVEEAVPGVQEGPMTMNVDSCPEVHFEIGSEGSINDADILPGSQFASGFDDPTEMQADEEYFDARVVSLMREFPLSMPIEGTHVLGRAARIENMNVGDPLVLAADWQTPYFTPVGIEVFNDRGETLGNLSESFFGIAGHRELACLLPYIAASVESVTPLSQRRGNARHALMDITLELDEELMRSAWDGGDREVLAKMKKLLALPTSQRVVMSHSALEPSQLSGNVDTSEALEDPYELISQATQGAADISSTEIVESEDESSDDEREAILSMLQLLMLMGEMSGIEYPTELVEQLEKAQAGDSSIDLEDLASKFNEFTPDGEQADYSKVSFAEGIRAEGRKFSIAIPDGWTVLNDYKETNVFMETIRPFVAVPQEANAQDNIALSDKIIYSNLTGDLESDEEKDAVKTPPFVWAIRFCSLYDRSHELGSMQTATIWDEEVEAENTSCIVSLAEPVPGSGSMEFSIFPLAIDHADFIRCSLTCEGDADLEYAKAMVLEIAKSVRLDEVVTSSAENKLNAALKSRVTLEEFDSILTGFHRPIAGLREMVFNAAVQKYAAAAEEIGREAVFLAGVRMIVEFSARVLPYYSSILDAFEKQIELGADKDESYSLLEAIRLFDEATFPTIDIFDDDSVELVKQSGLLDPSIELQQIRGRLEVLSHSLDSADEGDMREATATDSKQIRADRIRLEEFKLEALSRIERALSQRADVDEFIEICESVGFGFMQARQEACNGAASPFNSDEENAKAMCREFGKFNPIIGRYIDYMLDVVDAQVEMGVNAGSISKMIGEVEELMTLITTDFSCGDPVLDAVANAAYPVKYPENYEYLKERITRSKDAQ